MYRQSSLILAAGVATLASTAAHADSVIYRVTGLVDAGSPAVRIAEAAALSPGFVLDLTFDAQIDPDPQFTTADSQGYSPRDWSLTYTLSGEPTAFTDASDQPGQAGYAVYTGQLLTFDSSQTLLDLGVDDGSDSLISLQFASPGLADTFESNDVADLPLDLAFISGQIAPPSIGPLLTVIDASVELLTIASPPANSGGSPQAVPTPTAAVAGLMLMLLLCINQTHRARLATAADQRA